MKSSGWECKRKQSTNIGTNFSKHTHTQWFWKMMAWESWNLFGYTKTVILCYCIWCHFSRVMLSDMPGSKNKRIAMSVELMAMWTWQVFCWTSLASFTPTLDLNSRLPTLWPSHLPHHTAPQHTSISQKLHSIVWFDLWTATLWVFGPVSTPQGRAGANPWRLGPNLNT